MDAGTPSKTGWSSCGKVAADGTLQLRASDSVIDGGITDFLIPNAMTATHLAVIGGGIVGLATAWQYTVRYPGRRVVLLEKEWELAQHQSSRNSGVLHSGI